MRKENSFRNIFTAHLKKYNALYAKQAAIDWPDYLVAPRHKPMFFVELKRERNGKYGLTNGQIRMQVILMKNGHICLTLNQEDNWRGQLRNYI